MRRRLFSLALALSLLAAPAAFADDGAAAATADASAEVDADGDDSQRGADASTDDAASPTSEGENAPAGSDDDVAAASPDAAGGEPAAPTSAPPSDDDEKRAPLLRLHGGGNLRTDPGVHALRLDAGVQVWQLDFIGVVDPMFWTDGQLDTDLLVFWRSPIGIAPFAGWRTTALWLADAPQLQQNLLLGVAADLPSFFDETLRGQAGIELATMLVKHGGGFPTETIGFESGRSYIDFVNFALFVRYEFAVGML